MQKKLNSRGATLTEMIVVFALLGIMLIAAAQLIYSCTDIYLHAKTQSNGMQVADLIVTKISGELENSYCKGMSISISDDSEEIEYVSDEKDVILKINAPVGSKKLYIQKDTASYSAFDDSAYMGYDITRLSFKRGGTAELEDYPDNIIRVELMISGRLYGEYEKTAYIRIY